MANVCSNGADRKGKHKWSFVKNTAISKFTHEPSGLHGVLSLRGLYRCDCGADRIGRANHNAPDADLRAHIGQSI